MKVEITKECFQYSFIGGNTDIINECSKYHQLDKVCLDYIVSSHNIKLLNYVFENDLFETTDFDIFSIINSQNLKAVILLFGKDKNSIIPWCGAFKQTSEIFKNEEFDFSKKSSNQQTLLHFSSAYDNLDICILSYYSSQIDINAKDIDGKTALHYAIQVKSKDIIDFLISNGADINARDNDGSTVLHYASELNSKDIIEFLISKGADINARDNRGMTPLHSAEENHCEDAVQTLVINDIEINLKDNEGITALHIAAWNNSKSTCKILITHGADLNIRDNEYGRTPLHYAVENNSNDALDILTGYGLISIQKILN